MRTIAIYDSGVGGLSIFQAVQQRLPQHQYVFVSDNQAFPYGTKSEQALIPRVAQVVNGIIDAYRPDLLVVACNTASTVALPGLRKRWDMPFVGVVPAIKPAAALSQAKCIGVLATPATVQRAYTLQLIDEFAADCRVIRHGSSRLVAIAEQKLRGSPVSLDEIARELKPFLAHPELDVLVFACTHFPLLNKEIESIFQQHSHAAMLLDSRAGIARRVASLLAASNDDARTTPDNLAVFTRTLPPDNPLLGTLHALGFTRHETLDL